MQEALPPGFFLREAKASGVALLFDGLDEAAPVAVRNEIVNLIATLAARASGQTAG